MSLGTDLKRYSRGTLPRVAIITVVLLPLLYGAMYLWAFWNPFAEVNKVPVALVNADRGAVVDALASRIRTILGHKRPGHEFQVDGQGGPEKAMVLIGG